MYIQSLQGSEINSHMDDILKSIEDSVTAHDIFKILKTFSADIGLPQFIITTDTQIESWNENRSYVLTSFRSDVLNYCIDNKLFSKSPFFQNLQQSALPQAAGIAEHARNSSDGAGPLQYLLDNGIDHVACFPVRGPRRTEARIMFCGVRAPLSHSEMAEILYASMYAFDRLQQTLGESQSVERNPLTPRETDCLRLSSAGLSAREVASTLDMAVHTVNYHIANATVKMRAKNKTHAVAEALKQGWLDLRGDQG